jgi:hypothetical protein
LPTPDAAGQYHNLAFGQAQQLAPFRLAQPTWAPSSLQETEIIASIPNITEVQPATPAASPTPPTGPVQVVSVTFQGPIPDEFAVTINELKQGTPLGQAMGPGPGPGTTSTTITIAGHLITRTTWADTTPRPIGGPSASYAWTDQGTTFQLQALLVSSPVTEKDVEHMIASIIEQTSAKATPTPATSTATLQPMSFGQLQQVATFYVAQPSWLPSYLVVLGGDTAPKSDPGHPPIPIQGITLHYGSSDPNQHFSLEIDEFVDGMDVQIPNPTTTTLNLSGHSISRTTSADPNSVEIFRWQDQGTTFIIKARILNPLTEQDVERMIASMLDG